MLPLEAKGTYSKCALSKDNLGWIQVPQFDGIYKVHMNGKPKPQPIVSLVNSNPKYFPNGLTIG
jgi:hypothetical protein